MIPPSLTSPKDLWYKKYSLQNTNLERTKSARNSFRSKISNQEAKILLYKSNENDNFKSVLGKKYNPDSNLVLISFDAAVIGYLASIVCFCILVIYKDFGAVLAAWLSFSFGCLCCLMMCLFKSVRASILLTIPSIGLGLGLNKKKI